MYRDNRESPREMHKVVCSDCGKETEVPFKPDGDRPVYCKECFQKHRPKRFVEVKGQDLALEKLKTFIKYFTTSLTNYLRKVSH